MAPSSTDGKQTLASITATFRKSQILTLDPSEPARQYVSTEQVKFTGSPAFDDDLNYIVPHPDSITYVGEPSPEIDMAWEELSDGMSHLKLAPFLLLNRMQGGTF